MAAGVALKDDLGWRSTCPFGRQPGVECCCGVMSVGKWKEVAELPTSSHSAKKKKKKKVKIHLLIQLKAVALLAR